MLDRSRGAADEDIEAQAERLKPLQRQLSQNESALAAEREKTDSSQKECAHFGHARSRRARSSKSSQYLGSDLLFGQLACL